LTNFNKYFGILLYQKTEKKML